ncbi:hypothetical protein [Leyella stercorea]|uniref:hypothetical protein n=1 Tax=Leyella stercorea TaxID=363265 RepID=UPI001F3B1088|nr:hypothetical protein [Leyella stercorea]
MKYPRCSLVHIFLSLYLCCVNKKSNSRRNSLFFGSHAGAKRATMFYSLACSCRLQGINFFDYISDVINKAAALSPRTPPSKYRELLPDKWKQKNIAQE